MLRRILLACACTTIAPTSLFAQPTQADVLRSIGENFHRQSGDPTRLLALLLAAAGLAVLLVVLGHRRKRNLAPRSLHHHGKLLKEAAKALGLKPAEFRQLKVLVDDERLSSPLALLLCPSLLDRAITRREGSLDSKTLATITRIRAMLPDPEPL